MNDRQAACLSGKALANPPVRVVLVPLPPLERRADEPADARPVEFEVATKRPEQELGLLTVGDVRVSEVELELSVDVGGGALARVQQRPPRPELLVQRRAGDGGVEHELVKVRVVADGVVDDLIDVLGRVLLQPDDGRAEHADPMRLKRAHQLAGVGAPELDEVGVLALQAHPHPRDTQAHELFNRV
jgi:hypothetical protein